MSLPSHRDMIEAGTVDEHETNNFTVDWDGPEDPNNPKKLDPVTVSLIYWREAKIRFCSWSFRKKWVVTVLASAYTFLSPIASAMIAPAAPDIAAEFHIRSSVEIELTVTIFVLAYGTMRPPSTPNSKYLRR